MLYNAMVSEQLEYSSIVFYINLDTTEVSLLGELSI